MYNFVSLNLKCPVCGASLMNKEVIVDHKPSIHLLVRMDDVEGSVYLSSIYGSYNFSCDITLIPGHISEFYCPHCKNEISSKSECLNCSAPMIPFYLEMGGKVSICSRIGCKNHFVEFEDLTQAMQKLHEDYGYEETILPGPVKPTVSKQLTVSDEKVETIESGTFLRSYCPHCRKSLLENDLLNLRVKRAGVSGVLQLSPFLNVFTTKSSIYLPEDEVFEDLQCDRCGKSLIEAEKSCQQCGSPVAKIEVSARTRLIDFFICTKKGCRWHGLSDEDMLDIKLEDSLDW